MNIFLVLFKFVIPTQDNSFWLVRLHRQYHHGNMSQLQSGYESRKAAIQRCVNISKQEVQRLKQEKDAVGDSLEAHKKLRSEQTKVKCHLFRMMCAVQLIIETIVITMGGSVISEVFLLDDMLTVYYTKSNIGWQLFIMA